VSSPKPKKTAKEIFEERMRQFNLPHPVTEFKFDETRLWRFDYAWELGWPKREDLTDTNYAKVAVELDGRGRHQTPAGYAADCEKINAAQIQGWIVIKIPTRYVASDEFMVQLFDALKERGAIRNVENKKPGQATGGTRRASRRSVRADQGEDL
jgi:hypothetical protein